MKKLCLILALALLLAAVPGASLAAEKPVHLVWWIMTSSEAPVDWPEVEEKLNAYSAEKIGVTCDFRYYDSNQIALVSQTGEYFDIAFTSDYWNDFATNVSVGMFRDLKEDLDDYPDCASISNYAMIPMLWAVSNGVISGTDKGLEPTASANRAQVAVMMKAYNEHVVEK